MKLSKKLEYISRIKFNKSNLTLYGIIRKKQSKSKIYKNVN